MPHLVTHNLGYKMAQELADNEYWLVGARSQSLDMRLEYILVDVGYDGGRYTKDEREAWTWAHDFAAHANQDPNSGATDWVGESWIGTKKD
jgi:hypothetical protein